MQESAMLRGVDVLANTVKATLDRAIAVVLGKSIRFSTTHNDG